MPFVYFVPGPSKSTVVPGEHGLEHIVDAPEDLAYRQVFNGPGGNPGIAFGSRKSISEQLVGYFPSNQEWTAFDRFWIGRPLNEAFEPNQLKRPTAVSGHEWKDWTGKAWDIPIAKRWVDGESGLSVRCGLPTHLSVNKSGDWVVGGVIPRYQALWNLATKFETTRSIAAADAIAAGKDTYNFDLPSIDEALATIFGCNYRVSKFELGILGIITPTTVAELMRLVVDDPGFELIQKKTALDTGST